MLIPWRPVKRLVCNPGSGSSAGTPTATCPSWFKKYCMSVKSPIEIAKCKNRCRSYKGEACSIKYQLFGRLWFFDFNFCSSIFQEPQLHGSKQPFIIWNSIARLPVNVSPVSNVYDIYKKFFVMDFLNNAIISNPDPVAFAPFQLNISWWTRILTEVKNSGLYFSVKRFVYFSQRLCYSFFNSDYKHPISV